MTVEQIKQKAEEYYNGEYDAWLEGEDSYALEEEITKAFIDGYKECQKEHEWHYVNWKYFADKDYPENECVSYLVQLRNKDTLICEWETEEGFGCFYDSNLEPIDNDDVYAWQEIVFPKESE